MKVPVWVDREKVKGGLVSSGWAYNISFRIALIFVLLGIVSDAANITIGLHYTSWFLMAITAGLFGLVYGIAWAVSWYLNTNK
jgi:choline-glycine betaine transporter